MKSEAADEAKHVTKIRSPWKFLSHSSTRLVWYIPVELSHIGLPVPCDYLLNLSNCKAYDFNVYV